VRHRVMHPERQQKAVNLSHSVSLRRCASVSNYHISNTADVLGTAKRIHDVYRAAPIAGERLIITAPVVLGDVEFQFFLSIHVPGLRFFPWPHTSPPTTAPRIDIRLYPFHRLHPVQPAVRPNRKSGLA